MDDIFNRSTVVSFGNRHGQQKTIITTTPMGPSPPPFPATQLEEDFNISSKTLGGPHSHTNTSHFISTTPTTTRTITTITRENSTKRKDMDEPWWKLPHLSEFTPTSKAYKCLEHIMVK